MKSNAVKIFFSITLVLISLALFVIFFPTLGFYLLCFSAVIVFLLFSRFGKRVNISISIALFAAVWLLLIDAAFELQGRKVADSLCDYSNQKKMPDDHYLDNGMNSYTPVFTKYKYITLKQNPESFEDTRLSYIDLWGNFKVYCNADGEFECRSLQTGARIN